MQVDDELAARIQPLLATFLPRQRWFASDEPPGDVTITSLDVLQEDPLLLWLLVDVQPAESTEARTYQLVLGGRPADVKQNFLKGKERVTVGESGGTVFYEALVDPELALAFLAVVAPDEEAEVARPLLVEQSNTSVVYDERLILKLFRQLHTGPNPDVEVTRVLGDQEFPHVVPQRASLDRDGMDLAVVRDYMLASTDAWHLAHTSLRDLLGSRVAPEEAGGDFAADAYSLGVVTASLHVALADAFGTSPADPDRWFDEMRAQLERVTVPGRDKAEIVKALDAEQATVGAGGEPGTAIRIHGDLHLGQFLRTDTGWFVLDFEGEPARPLAERLRPSSPLRDVAGMLRSFDYAARAVLVERGRDVDPQLARLTEAWEERAVGAFRRGYLGVRAARDMLPADEAGLEALLSAFELDKAVYEVAYEQAHRPSWVDIPAAAIERLLAA